MSFRLICGIVLCCAALKAYANTPSRIQANYDLNANGFKVATVTETFVRTGTSYRLESVSRAYGFVAMIKNETIRAVSEGSLTPQGLQPATYSHLRDLDKERNATAKFDWAQATLSLQDRDGQRSIALPAGTQDRLSAMYQFQFIQLRDAHEVKFNLTDGSKIQDYFYLVMPEQSITIPFGICKAYYLVTKPEPDGWKSEVWLRTQDRLPCKAILTDSNGDRFIQILTGLTIEP